MRVRVRKMGKREKQMRQSREKLDERVITYESACFTDSDKWIGTSVRMDERVIQFLNERNPIKSMLRIPERIIGLYKE